MQALTFARRASRSAALAFAWILFACGAWAAAPTIVIDMPETLTPSRNVGIVFLQDGKEQKVRFDDRGRQVVIVRNDPFQVLVPDGQFFYVAVSTDRNSNYVAGDPIPFNGGVVMSRGSDEGPAGFYLVVADRYSFNTWSYGEMGMRSGYKVLNIKAIRDRYVGTQTTATEVDLLFFVARPYGSTQKPTTNEYEMVHLVIKPSAAR